MRILPDGDPEELYFVQQITKDLDEEEMEMFVDIYRSKRHISQVFLLTAAIGLVGVSGIQRFLAGQIGMGLLYFFTGGFCGIGTIIDMINHKKLALEANMKAAQESAIMIDRMAFE